MHRTRTLKILLLLAAAALALWLLWAVDDQRQLRISPTAPAPQLTVPDAAPGDLAATTRASTTLTNPRYSGQDDAGYGWEVTAARAVQSGTAVSSSLVMETLTAVWQQGQAYTLKADHGTYDMTAQTMDVSGNVQLAGAGLAATMPQATAALASREVRGQGGIQVTGRMGGYDVLLTAPSFTLTNAANNLGFAGPVHVELTE
ncbi:MAG: hypothetical protein H6922_05935 [Pseudomonadaceae bacterium]|nr:hypothetical protein [Pseudomonadaceae bacterium]